MRREMDELFGDVLERSFGGRRTGFTPRVDVSYAADPPRAIVTAAVNGARPGAIVLLHDAGGNRAQTVAALPRIIDRLRVLGYKLVTVPKLLLDNPAPANQRTGVPRGEAG